MKIREEQRALLPVTPTSCRLLVGSKLKGKRNEAWNRGFHLFGTIFSEGKSVWLMNKPIGSFNQPSVNPFLSKNDSNRSFHGLLMRMQEGNAQGPAGINISAERAQSTIK
jgi:hypothetical protein